MRIRYIVPFSRKIIIDDHWEIPMQGGKLRVVEEGGYAKGLELVFEKQPLKYAPLIQNQEKGKLVAKIKSRDLRAIFMKYQLDAAITFLECMYDIGLTTKDITTIYEGETSDEESQIKIKRLASTPWEIPLPLSFDMLTRAIMVAENRNGPRLEATLIGTARKALAQKEFINSFRYSFLLIEALYGEGQFKKIGLQGALKGSQEFLDIVEFAINDIIPARKDNTSSTAKLFLTKPSAETVIEHLVERRGFYFHSNVKRQDAWDPSDQGEAESLALLAIGIAGQIAMKAASLLFSPEYGKRHFEDAMHAGAEIVFHVHFIFRDPGENFDRSHEIEISMPGTKPTPRTAFDVAQKCLQTFRHNQPASDLISIKCKSIETKQIIFEMNFHIASGTSKED